MKNKTLWKRLAAVALAAVLAVPTALVPVKDADAKTVKNIILQEDFSGAEYDGSIVTYKGGNLEVVDGALKVTGKGNGGARLILPVEENTTYAFSYRVKVNASNTYSFREAWKTVDGQEDGYTKAEYGDPSTENIYADGEWHEVSSTYTVAADKNYMQYAIYSNTEQLEQDYDFLIDDVKVEKLVTVANVVSNGTFGTESADTTGWDVTTSEETPVIDTVYAANENFDNGASKTTLTPSSEIEFVDGALKITGTKSKGVRFDAIPVVGGTTYTISYKLKIETATLETMGFVETYSNGVNYKNDYMNNSLHVTTKNEWVEVKTTYTVPEEQNLLYLTVYNNNNEEESVFYVDDLEIYTKQQKLDIIKHEVLEYGDFEGANLNRDDKNWDVDNGQNVTLDESAGVNGSTAAVITRTNNTNAYMFYTSATAIFEVGKTYTLSYQAKTTGTAKIRNYLLNIKDPDDWYVDGADYGDMSDWTTITTTFTATKAISYPQIGFQSLSGEGTIYIDNVSLTWDESKPSMANTDGVGAFGKDGYGVQITDAKATATAVAEAGWYDFNVDVKGAEGTSVKVYADDAVVAEVEGTGDWQTVAGTFNAADGMETFAVESTGKVVFDNVDVYAHQHNATLVAGKDATCTVDGTKAYYECKACGKKYEDADCTKEASDLTIPAAHKISYVKKVAATCTKAGHEAYYTCDACKKVFADAEGTKEAEIKVLPKHKATEVKAVAATYTKTGIVKHYKCSCGKLYTDKACTKATTKAKLTVPVKKLTVAKTSVKSVTAKSKALAVKWTKKSGVTGYEVQVALKKNFKSGLKKATVKGASKTTVTVKKLKAKKTYYVRVRAYKKVEGKTFYSAWSSVKSKKTK